MTACPQSRIALVIQYVGTNFHGWQRQPHHRSVQEEIEKALADILGHAVTLHGAGRTDSGVHAAAQVAHFQQESPIPPAHWAKVLNARLDDDIVIRASARFRIAGTPVSRPSGDVIVIPSIPTPSPISLLAPLVGTTTIVPSMPI